MMNGRARYDWRRSARRAFPALGLGLLAIGGSVAVISVPVASARLRADEDAIVIRRSYKAGDSDRYRFVTDVVGQAGGAVASGLRLQITYKETTKEVKEDGMVTLTGQVEKALVKIGEDEQDITPLMPQWTQICDKQGRIVSTKLSGVNNPVAEQLGSSIQELVQSVSLFYPPKAVKIGETWMVAPPESKDKDPNDKFTGKATFVGKEAIKGTEALKVQLTIDKEMNKPEKAQVHSEGTGYIDPQTGKIVLMKGKAEGKGGQVKQAEFTLTRLTGDEKEEADKKPEAGKAEKP